MFEFRIEGGEAVSVDSLEAIWSSLDLLYQGREASLFWSVDGVASDMGRLTWQALCPSPDQFVVFLGVNE